MTTTSLITEQGSAIAPSSKYPYECRGTAFKVYKPDSLVEIAGLGTLDVNQSGMPVWKVMVAGKDWVELPNTGSWRSAMKALIELLEANNGSN